MKELNVIQTRLNAPKKHYNKFFDGYYRSAEDILEALKPLLKETGCAIVCTDEIVDVGGRLFVKATATLRNPGGEECSATGYAELNAPAAVEKKKLDPAQLTGGASSYARKYAMNGLFAIDDNKDADDKDLAKAEQEAAKAAAQSKPKAQAQPKPKEQPEKQPKELTREDWDRMVENEAAGRKTKDGERIRDWWIRKYKPGVAQIRMFDEACLKKAEQMPIGEADMPDFGNA